MNTQVDVCTICKSFLTNDAKSTTLSSMFFAIPFLLICSISFGKSSTWVWIVPLLATWILFCFLAVAEADDCDWSSLSLTWVWLKIPLSSLTVILVPPWSLILSCSPWAFWAMMGGVVEVNELANLGVLTLSLPSSSLWVAFPLVLELYSYPKLWLP